MIGARRPRQLKDLDEAQLLSRVQRVFGEQNEAQRGWRLGMGDDAALWRPRPGQELVVSSDLALESCDFVFGFFPGDAIGHRALAQNLSDLAAMAATPTGFLLSLAASPDLALRDLDAILGGMASLAHAHKCPLVGGDLSSTRGPLTLSITVLGAVPCEAALRRSGARVGDEIWLSGPVGGAAAALAWLLGGSARLYRRQASFVRRAPRRRRAALTCLLQPQPRLELAPLLRRHGRACIDISDGLLCDLQRLCASSGVGADLKSNAIPLVEGATLEQGLTGGEDYELIFTAPPSRRRALLRWASRRQQRLHRIGRCVSRLGLRLDGQKAPAATGHDHFAAQSD